MTWLKFLGSVSGLYALYYVIIILWDLARSRHAPVAEGWVKELQFSDDFVPQKVAAEEAPETKVKSAVASSGGVNLRDLFTLAREEAIQYTRPVSF
jgi:hypothetical protein